MSPELAPWGEGRNTRGWPSRNRNGGRTLLTTPTGHKWPERPESDGATLLHHGRGDPTRTRPVGARACTNRRFPSEKRQHHRLHPCRILNAGQKTGDAQGDRAPDYARGRALQSGTNPTGGDVACS